VKAWRTDGGLNRKAQPSEQEEVANSQSVLFTGTWQPAWKEERGFHRYRTATDHVGTKNVQWVEGWVLSPFLAFSRIYLGFSKLF